MDLWIVNPDRAPADFVPVQNDIVGLGVSLVWVFPFFQVVKVFFLEHREGVVSGNPLAKAFVVFKHWPVDHPQVVPLVWRNQIHFLGDGFPQVTQGITNHVEGIGHEKNQVAFLGPQAFVDRVGQVR